MANEISLSRYSNNMTNTTNFVTKKLKLINCVTNDHRLN